MSQTKAQLVGGVGFSTADSLTVHNGLAVTGVITATSFAGNITGNITGNATGLTGTPGIAVGIITASSISAVSADFSGNVTIGGTLQYEDVTNIDAIGIVTARSGINITGAGMTVTGISTFRGDVQVADKIIHLDDTNTAIRFPAADTFSVETAGSERLLVDSSGNVDIGNNDGSSSNTGWYIQPDGTAYVFTNGSTDAVKIFAGSADERITLKGDGDLVISDKITHMGDTNTNIRFPAADTFTVETGGSERLRVDSSGNLGIGTNNPQRKLVVSDNGTEGLEFFPGDSANGSTINAYNRATSSFTPLSISAQDYRFSPSGGAEALRITSARLVGINTDSPGTLLELRGESSKEATITFNRSPVQGTNDGIIGEFLFENVTDSVALLSVKRESAADDAYFQFATQATGGGLTERLRITSGGAIQNYYNTNLPVTDSRPILQLGYSVIGDDSSGRNGVTCNAYPVSGDSSWHYISSSSLGAAKQELGFGEHKFYTAAAGTRGNDITWDERLRIASSGQIGLGGANYGTSGQVITSNGSGSAPTWQNSEGNTLDLVASGAIADGDTVIIRTDGKVGIVTGAGGAEGKGSFATADTDNSQYIRVTNAGTNKICMIYNDGGNSSYGTAVVGTISDTSITFGTPVAFNSTSTNQHEITYDANADKVVVLYRNGASAPYNGTAKVGTISGTSISFGSAATFDTYTGDPGACFDSDNNKIIVCYRDGGNGNYGTGVVGTVSGTSISFGSVTAFNNGDSEQHSVCFIGDSQVVDAFHYNGDNSKGYAVVGTVSGTSITFGTIVKFTDDQDIRNISCVYDDANDKVVIIWTDSSGNRKAIVGTPSGTGGSGTLSFGSATTFGQTSSNLTTPHMHAIYNTFIDKVVVAYRDGDNSDKGTVALGTVSGTSISFGTGFVYEDDGYTDFNWPATANEQNIFIGYRDYSDSSHARGVIYSAPFSNTNVTAANFIGISDGAYTDGQTAKIRFAGVDDAQVGLTTGSFYYVQASGDLGTSAGNPSVEAGVAISATKILLKKNQ